MDKIIFDIAALHGRDAAKLAANMIIDEYKESDLKDRRDYIGKHLQTKMSLEGYQIPKGNYEYK
jgi:hypothetical protein